ncbi:MAG: KGG domain-containing protein [Weeksellaceae bacterium]
MATTGSSRGFGAMDAKQQREIARKGGVAVSQDREHMSEIGRKGGEKSRGGGRKSNS